MKEQNKTKTAVVILVSNRVKCHLKHNKHYKGYFFMLEPTIKKKYNIHEYLWTKTHKNHLLEVETTGDAREEENYYQYN